MAIIEKAMSVRGPALQWGLTVLGVGLGIVAIILPFTYGVSPGAAVLYGASEWLDFFDEIFGGPFALGFPFLLTLPIAGVYLCRLSTGVLSRQASIAAYVVAGAMGALTLSLYLGIDHTPDSIHEWLVWIGPLGTLGLGMWLIVRNARARLPRALNAAIAMQVVYVMNGVFALIGFFEDWDTGAYFALATVFVYVIQLSLASRQLIAEPYSYPGLKVGLS